VKFAACTLFEDNYHYGVVALVNSLYKNGYRGSIYVGYKGELPPWAILAREDISISWAGAKTFSPTDDLNLHFLPLNTNYHLTNYKPDFMLELLNGPAFDAEGIFYFDPDITVNADNNYLKNWIEGGIAVCEDVNSPLPLNHPRRLAWRKYFGNFGIEMQAKEPYYVNGGFVGLKREFISFLHKWKELQELMGLSIGGLQRSAFPGYTLDPIHLNPLAPFSRTDQDTLNCAIEETSLSVSFIGKEAMGFKAGTCILPHSLGTPKPWNWQFIQQLVKGVPPNISVKSYWFNANGILKVYSISFVVYKRILLRFASFLGRFYSRH